MPNSFDDGLGPNPYPEGDPRHKWWQVAARRAAEEEARLKATYLSQRPEDLTAHLDFFVGWFDIRAKYLAILIVGGYQTAEVYQQALNRMSDAVLEWARRAPSSVQTQGLGDVLRLRLMQRSAYWLAEALRRAREAEENKRQESDRISAVWSDVKIAFTSDHRVQVTVGDRSYTGNYAEMGFENRTTEAPNKAWATLRQLAKSNGVIRRAGATQGAIGRAWRREFRKSAGNCERTSLTGISTFRLTPIPCRSSRARDTLRPSRSWCARPPSSSPAAFRVPVPPTFRCAS